MRLCGEEQYKTSKADNGAKILGKCCMRIDFSCAQKKTKEWKIRTSIKKQEKKRWEMKKMTISVTAFPKKESKGKIKNIKMVLQLDGLTVSVKTKRQFSCFLLSKIWSKIYSNDQRIFFSKIKCKIQTLHEIKIQVILFFYSLNILGYKLQFFAKINLNFGAKLVHSMKIVQSNDKLWIYY